MSDAMKKYKAEGEERGREVTNLPRIVIKGFSDDLIFK